MAQGNLIFHFVFWLVTVHIMNTEKDIVEKNKKFAICVTIKHENLKEVPNHLGHAMKPLQFMHLACFILQGISEAMQKYSRRIHFSNVLQMITVPIYQASILQAYFEIVKQEDLFK